MISPLLWPAAAGTLVRTFGVRGIVLRSVHEVRRTTSRFRRTPRHDLGAQGLEPLAAFEVDKSALRSATMEAEAIARADRVARGEYQAYRWQWRPLPQESVDWRTNPSSGHRYGRAEPWWRVRHLDPAAGDIKDVWEPARFAWVFDLVRGYLVTGDSRYVSAAFDRVARWSESSPPFDGVHWSCGQEVAIRATALLYLEANARGAQCIRAAHRLLVRDILAASGERIADGIGYAVSQRNNHAISEAMGLVALGARFTGIHSEAEGWLRRGRRMLDRLVVEQFAPDGWYTQHSFTYLRLALDQCVIAERALRSRGLELSTHAIDRICAATRLLVAVADSDSGVVPNHGANDGAFVHPITLAAYRDFRPTITAACAIFNEPLPADIAEDKEVLAWLRTSVDRRSEPRADGLQCGASGWVAGRIAGLSVFLRAGRYRSRPSHLDPLHLDIRFSGRETIVDPGTFSYNAPAPWRNPLVAARAHNGPLVDGREPGVRGPRFLWLVWPRARVRVAKTESESATIVAEVPRRVRRTVRIGDGTIEVLDQVLARGTHALRVAWLFHPDSPAVELACSERAEMIQAAEGDTTGWFSPHYYDRIASRSFVVETASCTSATVRTRFSLPTLAGGADQACDVVPARSSLL